MAALILKGATPPAALYSSRHQPAPSQTHSDALRRQFYFEMFCHGPRENITCVANECLHWWSISPVVTCFPLLGSATVAHHSSSGTDREAVQLNTVPNVQPRASNRKCDREVVSWSVFSHLRSLEVQKQSIENVQSIESVYMEATKKTTAPQCVTGDTECSRQFGFGPRNKWLGFRENSATVWSLTKHFIFLLAWKYIILVAEAASRPSNKTVIYETLM